jgi:hypothetical protein
VTTPDETIIHFQDMTETSLGDMCRAYARAIRRQEIKLGRWQYAIGVAHGVRTAIHCGVSRFSIVEFGVWNGVGLLELCEIAEYWMRRTGVEITVYGVDSAAGLPQLTGYMDHPELWHTGAFKIPDPSVLRAKLPSFASLLIGDVADVMPELESKFSTIPLAFASFDVDLYSSTKRALRVLNMPAICYLPVVPATFDDSDSCLSHSAWCGEAAAVREFNEVNTLRKIDAKPTFDLRKFYACQIFDHPIRQGTARSRWPMTLGWF